LCGPSHSLMDFKLIVVSEEEYDQWVADMQDFDSEELDLDGAAVDGEELFDDKGCISCHATDTQNYSAGRVPQGPDLTQFGDRTNLAKSEEHTSELQSRLDLVCRLLREKKHEQPRDIQT